MANIVRGQRGGEPAPLARGSELGRMDPFRVMDRMMRSVFGWDPLRELEPFGPSVRGFNPDIELKETQDSYVLKADLPGIDEKDLDISVVGNQITISGKREAEDVREDDRYYAYERSYGSFSRTFTLPEGVDSENIRADLRNGVLDIVVPKKPEVQPKRINIQTGRTVEAGQVGAGAKETQAPEQSRGKSIKAA